jgi:hypothetical protein
MESKMKTIPPTLKAFIRKQLADLYKTEYQNSNLGRLVMLIRESYGMTRGQFLAVLNLPYTPGNTSALFVFECCKTRLSKIRQAIFDIESPSRPREGQRAARREA